MTGNQFALPPTLLKPMPMDNEAGGSARPHAVGALLGAFQPGVPLPLFQLAPPAPAPDVPNLAGYQSLPPRCVTAPAHTAPCAPFVWGLFLQRWQGAGAAHTDAGPRMHGPWSMHFTCLVGGPHAACAQPSAPSDSRVIMGRKWCMGTAAAAAAAAAWICGVACRHDSCLPACLPTAHRQQLR